MSISIAPFPSAGIRTSLPASEWASITSVFLTATSHLLQLPAAKFPAAITSNHSVLSFILSYLAHATPEATTNAETHLRRKVFQLLHRILHETPKPPKELLESDRFFLGLARLYGKSSACRALLKELWTKQEPAMTIGAGKLKAHLGPQLAAGLLTNETVAALCRLFMVSPETAAAWCAGEELWEVAAEAEDKTAIKVAGRAVLEAAKVNWSVVTDALFALLSVSGRQQKALAEGLVKFGVVERLQIMAKNTEVEGRVAGIAERVKDIEVKRSKAKEKGAANIDWRQEARVELDSKIAAIQELFPDLGAGFVTAALQALGGDVEAVTSALLEDNLPPGVASLDRQLQESNSPLKIPTQPEASSSSLPLRHNVYDNDALDLMLPSASSRLTLGRRTQKETADTLLSKHDLPKSAIFSALAAIDLDEDEHDDTYDAADVGGAVDSTSPEDDRERPVAVAAGAGSSAMDLEIEKKLFNLWKSLPGSFARSVRGTKDRMGLKAETGWTDEAIEGWAIMLKREPQRERRLEQRLKDVEISAVGAQNVIENTRWREGDEETPAGRGRGRGGHRGRGGRPRGDRRGGDGGGESSAAGGDTSRGRGRKEVNKGRVANHSRKNQRAKKVGRGAFMGGE
ncbi:hypothetical protein EX30DRAFT_393540 [Ascodesmis nigricans]|uniref:CUE domain-containing protein n=1 Tax=Ascodesmis nigricans TaxID=341454 RepID=A0A4S2N4C5_9PEZI|nr:hypothetical protein EX30DRAFT_393540 [Ascodesmis nigricans]